MQSASDICESQPVNGAALPDAYTSITKTKTGATTRSKISKRSANRATRDTTSQMDRSMSLPRGWAQPLLAAYGDAFMPQIAELIARAIIEAEAEEERRAA
jgi:hypothetical protein